MLSRVADNLYWFGRYLQRAENTARLVNVHAHLVLDIPRKLEAGWEPLVEILGETSDFSKRYKKDFSEANVVSYLLSDEKNPGSIVSSLKRARENVREVREGVPRQVWEELNDIHLYVADRGDKALSRARRLEFLNEIIDSAMQINGLLMGDMNRDLGFQFLRLGTNLEQADMTTRIIDVRSSSLIRPKGGDLAPFENIQWMSVLRSLAAYEMYRRHVRARVSGARVLQFLLQNRHFPRSVAFGLDMVASTLGRLPPNRGAEQAIGRARDIVLGANLPRLVEGGVHEFIDEVQIGIAEVHGAIEKAWFITAPDSKPEPRPAAVQVQTSGATRPAEAALNTRVALRHFTHYDYDRPVTLSPQRVRLRPAPYCRTPIPSYSLKALPISHYLNWLQDPTGNWQARLVFTEKVAEFGIEVNLVADLKPFNPFDFFVESSAEQYPIKYEEDLGALLAPYMETSQSGRLVTDYVAGLDRSPRRTVDVVVQLSQRIASDIRYLVRNEPGVQTPEETLKLAAGSCRDSGWLLVHCLRELGFAARFVSGYLIQLKTGTEPLMEGHRRVDVDATELHAWAEVYLPGAGWIGLDATSGLLAAEGHIPLCAAPDPEGAAPVSGQVEKCQVTFSHEISVERVEVTPQPGWVKQ